MFYLFLSTKVTEGKGRPSEIGGKMVIMALGLFLKMSGRVAPLKFVAV